MAGIFNELSPLWPRAVTLSVVVVLLVTTGALEVVVGFCVVVAFTENVHQKKHCSTPI